MEPTTYPLVFCSGRDSRFTEKITSTQPRQGGVGGGEIGAQRTSNNDAPTVAACRLLAAEVVGICFGKTHANIQLNRRPKVVDIIHAFPLSKRGGAGVGAAHGLVFGPLQAPTHTNGMYSRSLYLSHKQVLG